MFQVVLDKLSLDKEKRDLLQENTQLRAVLKQYLDGKVLLNVELCKVRFLYVQVSKREKAYEYWVRRNYEVKKVDQSTVSPVRAE